MKTIIAAIFALTATTGLSFSQEAPMLIGKLSANVAERYNGDNAVKAVKVDRSRKAVRTDRKGSHKRYPRLVTADQMVFTGR